MTRTITTLPVSVLFAILLATLPQFVMAGTKTISVNCSPATTNGLTAPTNFVTLYRINSSGSSAFPASSGSGIITNYVAVFPEGAGVTIANMVAADPSGGGGILATGQSWTDPNTSKSYTNTLVFTNTISKMASASVFTNDAVTVNVAN